MRGIARFTPVMGLAAASGLSACPGSADEATSIKRKFPQGQVKFLGNDYMALNNG